MNIIPLFWPIDILVKHCKSFRRLRREHIEVRDDLRVQKATTDRIFQYLVESSNGKFPIVVLENGSKFFVPEMRTDFIQKVMSDSRKPYEHELLTAFDKYFTDGATIIDAGAYIGNHSIYWAQHRGCSVYAFEARQESFDWLSYNIMINQLEKSVQAFWVGLGDIEGKGDIKRMVSENKGGIGIRHVTDGTIKIKPLDAFLPQFEKVDVLKIDVEGFEQRLLQGAANLIDTFKPTIWIESFPEQWGEVHKWLQGRGYEVLEEHPGSNYFLKVRGQ